MKTLCNLILTLMLAIATIPIATAQAGPSYPYSVALSWTLSTGTVTGQNVYRGTYTTACPATSTYTKLTATALSATATTYSDTTATQGAWCYFVTALNGTSESGPSNVYSDVVIPPPPPTGLGATVSQVDGQNQINLTWTLSIGNNITAEWAGCNPTLPITTWHQLSGPTVVAWSFIPSKQTGTQYCAVYSVSDGVKSGPATPVEVTL
jgi:hypothetical protein